MLHSQQRSTAKGCSLHDGLTNPHHRCTTTLLVISDHLSKAAISSLVTSKRKLISYSITWCANLPAMLPFTQLQKTLEGSFSVLCTAFRPAAVQTDPVLAKLGKSHLTDASVKTRGYFSNAMEPMVGGSAFTKISLARIATASSFVMASAPEKQCSMYPRKHGRKC